MKIDEEGLERVAKRFMQRREVTDLGLTLEDVKRVLLEHAKGYSGCVNCIYSGPYHGVFSWKARHCVLGLSQNTCTMRKAIVVIEK